MFQCALGWCPPLWSYQGSSKSSNTKSCGCRLVGDEQGHPGDQGRCDWPEFCYRTWPMHIFQSAKSTKKGAVCQVPTVFLNCSASREILTKKELFLWNILSNIQNRFKAGLNHPVESTINQIQQTRNIETRWEEGEAIRWRAVPISPVQR